MSVITNNSFKCPIVGIDPVTKGTFTITWAQMLLDYDYDEDTLEKETTASGEIIISGIENPLFIVGKEAPLRLQGLLGSVEFGTEKRFIRIKHITNYELYEADYTHEVTLSVIFNILGNLEYLEDIETYRNQNLL